MHLSGEKVGVKPAVELSTPALDTPGSPSSEAGADPEQPPHGKRQLLVYVVAMLSVLLLVSLILKTVSNKSALRTAKRALSIGDGGRTIRLTGTTEAVNMRSIVAPILEGEHLGMLTITKLVPAGTKVHRGDVLAEFDRQAQTREFIDKQAQYEDLANKVMEEQAKENAARAADETDIVEAESNLRKAELEAQKLELLSRIDAEKNQEALQEARATFQQLRTTFDLKRQSAHAGIRLIELQRDRARQVMKHAQKNAELMEVRATIDGVVVLNTIWKQGKMGEAQEGDQVRPGIIFMQVVDPSQMQVRAFANQEDFLNLQLEQQAQVRLDAYPQLVFAGSLEEMAPAATSGDFSPKLRKFAVVFSIAGSDPKLMPDLSAAVDVNVSAQAGGVGAFH